GIGIELHLAHMAAVGEGGSAWSLADMAHVERGGRPFRQRDARAQLLSELHDPDRAVGACNNEASLPELDIAHRGFEYVRGNLLALLDCLGGGLHNGGTAMHDRFRAAGAATSQEFIAIALKKADAVEWNAELFAQHLREGGCMTLPVIQGARDDSDHA